MIKGRQLTFDTFGSTQLVQTIMSGGRRYDHNGEGLLSKIKSGGREYSMRSSQNEWQKSIDPFLRDIIAIQGSDPYGRLFGKMQVFSTPLNNLVSNRGTHTAKVVSIAMQIAHILGLNIYLCIAIALGHDIGHCPYGPNGGRILRIKHPLNSVIILQEVAELNLTREVILGILYHSLDKNNLDNGNRLSNEAFAVAIADKIAYLPPDLIDFDRMGKLKDLILPEELKLFGFGNGKDFIKEMQRICISALIEESLQEGTVSFSKSEIARAFQKIRDWAYTNVYNKLDYMPERAYHQTNLDLVLEYFVKNGLAENLAPEFAISMMTDLDINFLSEILKKGYITSVEKSQIKQLSIFEIIKSLKGKNIDHNQNPLEGW